jgi:hypothetical protein
MRVLFFALAWIGCCSEVAVAFSILRKDPRLVLQLQRQQHNYNLPNPDGSGLLAPSAPILPTGDETDNESVQKSSEPKSPTFPLRTRVLRQVATFAMAVVISALITPSTPARKMAMAHPISRTTLQSADMVTVATKDDIDKLMNKMDENMKDINERFQVLDAKFDKVRFVPFVAGAVATVCSALVGWYLNRM